MPCEEPDAGTCDDAPPSQDALVRGERRDALHAAVRRLPARQRALAEALLAEPVDGYAGIAEELGMPIGSIGPIRARFLAGLRRDPQLLRAVA